MSVAAGAERFAGKVSIVTGGGGNIGRATARRLASEGSSVTVADLSADAAAKVVAEIEAAGGTARAQATDVTDPDAVEAMVRDTVAAYGGLDVLHNNAAAIALNGKDQDVVTMDLDTWRQVLDVNLTGPMLGCRFAIPAMLERGGGAIVNTASAAAFYGVEDARGLRHVEGGSRRAHPVRRDRVRRPGHPLQRGRARSRRRPGRPGRARRPDGGPAPPVHGEPSRRPPRLPGGDRPRRRLPGVRRCGLRHGRDPARRRRHDRAQPRSRRRLTDHR